MKKAKQRRRQSSQQVERICRKYYCLIAFEEKVSSISGEMMKFVSFVVKSIQEHEVFLQEKQMGGKKRLVCEKFLTKSEKKK